MLTKKKPSVAEKKQFKVLGDELDILLSLSSPDDEVFGLYEGDEEHDGEYRLFLSCPDTDKLIKRLRPWLENLDWLGNVYAMKRYGNMYDEDAEEERFEF